MALYVARPPTQLRAEMHLHGALDPWTDYMFLQLLKRRQKIVNDLRLPALLQMVGITNIWSSGSGYGFVLVEGEIMAGRGS